MRLTASTVEPALNVDVKSVYPVWLPWRMTIRRLCYDVGKQLAASTSAEFNHPEDGGSKSLRNI
jgi:hypothetical protein